MKLGFVIAYIIVSLALVVFLVRAAHQKKENARYIKWVMGFACICVLSSVVQLMTMQRLTANIAYGVFFISIDWLLTAILGFCNDYCKFGIERYIKPWIFIAVCVVDSVQIMLNPFLNHAYTMSMALRGGETYWIYDAKAAFQVHLLWSYVLVAMIFGMLLYKAVKMPRMYQAKYHNVFLFLCIVVLLDALHLILGTVIDFSVLGFPLAAIAIYYYAVEFIPRALVNKTLGLAVDEMLDGVIIADVDNCAIYANDCVKEMLHLKASDADCFRKDFDVWCRTHYQSPDENFIYDWTMESGDGEKRYLKVH